MQHGTVKLGTTLCAAALFIIFVLQLRQVDSNDLGWQIKTGELIIENQQLPTRDVFTYTIEGSAVPSIGWLGQMIIAGVYRGTGFYGLRLFAVSVIAAAFVLAGAAAVQSARRQGYSLSNLSLLCALGLGLLTCATNTSIRLQIFAFLGFAAVMYLAQCDWSLGRKLICALPVLLIWQNCHPSVAVVVVVLFPGVVIGWWGYRRKRRQRPPLDLTLLVLLAGLVQFATPEGIDILQISAMNVRVSRDWLQISEWLPAYAPQVRHALVYFWVALVLSIILLLSAGRARRWEDIAQFVILSVLVVCGARFTIFFSAGMIPLWSRWIEQVRPAGLFDPVLGRSRRVFPWLYFGCIVAICGPWLIDKCGRRPILHDDLAEAAVIALKQKLPAGRIYNYREYAGLLILEGYPRWKVAIDGRLYLYDREAWHEYHEAALGQLRLDELVRRHRPDAFVLRPDYHAALVDKLKESAAWQQFYSSACCVVFVRSES